MKILKLNTNAGGGAGIAAIRQQLALRQLGHDCRLLVLKQDWKLKRAVRRDDGDRIRLAVPGAEGSFNSALAAALTAGNRTERSNTWMSLWPAELPFDDELCAVAREFDVVHLHWTSHLVSSRSLRWMAESGLRLVVTCHDMNWFTAACHYSAGCDAFQTACHDCPQLVEDPMHLVRVSGLEKTRALAGLPATWVFPSDWLAGEFRRSAIGRSLPDVEVVRNCLDVDHWVIQGTDQRSRSRAQWGVRPEDLLFVAGAQSNDERRKGFEFADHAIQRIEGLLPDLTSGRPVIVASFGRGKPAMHRSSPWLQHLHLGPLGESELASLMGAADLLLFPSLEENFSNTILEALLCGCPVLGFSIGGVPEAVRDGENGLAVREVSRDGYAAGLESLVREGGLAKLRAATARWAEANRSAFAPVRVGEQLEAIYRRLPLDQSHAPSLGMSESPPSELALSLSQAARFSDSRREFVLRQVKAAVAPQEPHLRCASLAPSYRSALFIGFSEPEWHGEWGAVQWVCMGARIHFRAEQTPHPVRRVLVIQIIRQEMPMSLWEEARAGLTVRLDGVQLAAIFVSPRAEHDHAYIVADLSCPPEVAADHCVELCFPRPLVPLSQDARGLCLLTCGTGIGTLAPELALSGLRPADCALLLMDSVNSSLVSTRATPDSALWAWLDLV